jgi:hypothetical protein
MSRLLLVDHEGRMLVDTPLQPKGPEVEPPTVDEFYDFCAQEAHKASTVNKKKGQ